MLLSASEIISRTWKIFTTHFIDITKFMVLFGIFFAGLQGLRIASLTLGFTGNVILFVLVFLLVTIIAGLVIFWLNLALIKSLGEAVQNQKIESIISALKNTGPLYIAAFGASLLTGILVFFGTLLLIIPGIIFAVWYLFAIYIVIFEKKDAVEAMQSSKALVVGRWWSIVWRAVVPQVLFIVILVVLQILIMLPLSFLQGAKILEVIDMVLSILVSAIFTPLSTLAMLIFYFNVRENPVVRESNLLTK